MLPLDKFESHIDAKILARGIAYHQDQAVSSLEESSKGRWEAVVSGSQNYEVDIQLKQNEVINWQCDCPYDGPICKHVVAVLFAIRGEKPAASKKKKGKKRKMSFEDILSQLDIEELRDFIRHQKTQKREFGEQFMLFFADKDPNIDVEKIYRNMVRQLVKKHTDQGFMHYRSTFDFSRAVYPIIQKANQALSKNNFREAIAIGQVLCLEGMNVITMCDDSAGNIGEIVAEGTEILERIAQKTEVAPQILDRLFAWLQRQLADTIWFNYGDFGYTLLNVAEAIASRINVDEFLKLLDKIQSIHDDDDYTIRAVKQQRIRFLQTIGREQEATQLIQASMDIVEVRLNVVEKAIAQKDYLHAKKLIAEGIAIAEEKEHPGTVSRWEKVLLEIAQAEHDMDTFRFFTQRFAFNRTFNKEYYQKWKASFSTEEWPGVIAQHIQSVIENEKAKPLQRAWQDPAYNLFERLAPIYIVEQQWEQLLHLIPEQPRESLMNTVHPHLAKRYPSEILAHYRNVLINMTQEASNRNAYKSIANLMKKIKQDIKGSHSTIDELATSLIQQYSRRPAMQEEFGKVIRQK